MTGKKHYSETFEEKYYCPVSSTCGYASGVNVTKIDLPIIKKTKIQTSGKKQGDIRIEYKCAYLKNKKQKQNCAFVDLLDSAAHSMHFSFFSLAKLDGVEKYLKMLYE